LYSLSGVGADGTPLALVVELETPGERRNAVDQPYPDVCTRRFRRRAAAFSDDGRHLYPVRHGTLEKK
jgi:hypothetical protein